LEIAKDWKRLPPFARFVIVGIIGVIASWIVYNIILVLNPIDKYKATSTWILAYILGVWQQHGLHRFLTFENTEIEYNSSLARSYLAYLLGLILSTPLNFGLVEVIGWGIQASWLASVITSTIANYFLLKRFAFEA
jgi:putative flippase GtrA